MTFLNTISRPKNIWNLATKSSSIASSSLSATAITITAAAASVTATSSNPSSSPTSSGIVTLSRRCLSSVGEESSKKDKLTDVLIRVIDSRPRTPPKPSPEEAQRRYEIGRNYVIGKFNQHNDLEHDLACKIKMKRHAIDLLPKPNDEDYGYLKKAAMKVDVTSDDAMPPYYRPIPVETPPIPGYDPSKYVDEEGED